MDQVTHPQASDLARQSELIAERDRLRAMLRGLPYCVPVVKNGEPVGFRWWGPSATSLLPAQIARAETRIKKLDHLIKRARPAA